MGFLAGPACKLTEVAVLYIRGICRRMLAETAHAAPGRKLDHQQGQAVHLSVAQVGRIRFTPYTRTKVPEFVITPCCLLIYTSCSTAQDIRVLLSAHCKS